MDGDSVQATKGEECGRSRKRQVRDRQTGISLVEGNRELTPETSDF